MFDQNTWNQPLFHCDEASVSVFHCDEVSYEEAALHDNNSDFKYITEKI